eukprot:scaffold429_cov269-Pinguiococcus_pyrenoidosus.AAC.5
MSHSASKASGDDNRDPVRLVRDALMMQGSWEEERRRERWGDRDEHFKRDKRTEKLKRRNQPIRALVQCFEDDLNDVKKKRQGSNHPALGESLGYR